MSVDADHAGQSRGFVVQLSTEERARAFRAARRHSIAVKTLKVLLPLAALGMVSLYFIPTRLAIEIDGATASLEGVSVESGNLKMVNPKLSGMHPDYGRYEIRADTAMQNVDTPQKVLLDAITGSLVSPDGDTTRLQALSGLFDTEAQRLTFQDGVSIEGRAGLSVKLRSATVHFADQLIVSDEPVSMQFRGSRITADGVRLNTGKARVVFSGDVKVRLEPRRETDTQ
ncbi:LPS export ABC transporter periplasmic protein LptC [Dichotomicrobium thermohalophilum]|uniref:Lipopolysaccharide export system protein LptC n=1 Tax=Dichotomicrobium thermohalophilum TaxID=933063 RepID=A0A397Q5V3_9HYPH|nr:LPS export ABC transporter periplasmic protein LptC [Dichotomicrobium thermohalophilum]RIA56646.1 lipopolysaccharide export system protein LptC [Dichotomicrobium thermohalophilum]